MKRIVSISIRKELQNAYLEYAMSVIIRRAIPDCRDGLKTVHRRILFSMYKSKNHYIYKKSARIVGDVMGRFHPHGDNAIYSAIIRMSQDFLLQLPLIKGQGNFGSADGESAAQMRYTEVKLSKTAKYLLEDTNKNIVEFNSNYDSTEFEPKVLPAQFPNLIVNGATGIAVGMATNIPTHNLKEVINYCIEEVECKNKKKLSSKIIIPDFPTGGTITNYEETIKSLLKGRGKIEIKGGMIIEEQEGKKKLIIKEIPYQISKKDVLISIAALNKNKIMDSIGKIKDETNKLGMRIVLEIKSNSNIELLINEIFSKTQLQGNFSINMLSLDYGKAKILGIDKIINSFISFKKITVKKKINFLLTKSKKQIHILLACIVTIINLDEILLFIKQSISLKITERNLVKNKWKIIKIKNLRIFSISTEKKLFTYLTPEQSKEILNMKLNNLSFLEKNRIVNEIISIFSSIKNYTKSLISNEKINFIIRRNFIEIKSTLAFPRKTMIKNSTKEIEKFYLIKRESMIITLTKKGFIKKIPLQVYKTQERGGKGKFSIKMCENDTAVMSLVTYSNSSLLFFSSQGKVYKLQVTKIPLSNTATKGDCLINILPLKKKEEIRSILNVPTQNTKWDEMNILFVTQKGKIRKNKLNEFKKIKRNGKIAMKLKNNDKLVSVDICSTKSNILIATSNGKAIQFSSESIRIFKSRISQGLKAMKFHDKTDGIVSMSILSSKKCCYKKDCNYREFILTITRQGYGKITSSYDYKKTKRNNLGVINITPCSRNGNVVSSFTVYKSEEIILMTTLGKIIRINVDKIRITNRNTKGVKIITLESREKVSSASIISKN